MRLRQEARVLKGKALSSLVTAMEEFNLPRDDGRATRVLLHLQHAFEMLLKAALVQAGVSVSTARPAGPSGSTSASTSRWPTARSSSAGPTHGPCARSTRCATTSSIGFNEVPEQLLYLHTRAGVTLFDEVLQRVFGERLAGHLPVRVLPVSAAPPQELAILLDDEYSQIAALLRPGRRARHQARARIRTLLAMEAHVDPEARVSSKDVDRVERGMRSGSPRGQVFPRLDDIATSIDGDGVTVIVHFTKTQARQCATRPTNRCRRLPCASWTCSASSTALRPALPRQSA